MVAIKFRNYYKSMATDSSLLLNLIFVFCIQTNLPRTKHERKKLNFVFIVARMRIVGATLEKAGSTVTWENVGNTKEFPSPFYKLVVRQLLLGHTAKADEYNTVEVSSNSVRLTWRWRTSVFLFCEFHLQVESSTISETVKVPIAVLKVGETRSVQTLLEFPDAPVTFKLVEGNGPVYIHGQQLPGNYEIEGPTVMSDEEDDGVSANSRWSNVKFANPKTKSKTRTWNSLLIHRKAKWTRKMPRKIARIQTTRRTRRSERRKFASGLATCDMYRPHQGSQWHLRRKYVKFKNSLWWLFCYEQIRFSFLIKNLIR